MRNLITGFIIGAFLTYITALVFLSLEYGRLANHLYCDMSVNHIETLK